jgi:hypothetical protein
MSTKKKKFCSDWGVDRGNIWIFAENRTSSTRQRGKTCGSQNDRVRSETNK